MADLDAAIRAHVGRLCQAPDERTPIDRLALAEAYYRATQVIGVVLDLHAMHPEPRRVYEQLCDRHSSPADPDFPAFEAIDACPECRCSVQWVCSHCECPNDTWPCPTIKAIAGALRIEADGG